MRSHSTLLPLLASFVLVPSALARLDTDPWLSEFGGTPDLSFSGITTFAHLPHSRCLDRPDTPFDVAILGVPFDTAVSYRPGARFGPNGLRSGSRRQRPERGYSSVLGINPYMTGLNIVSARGGGEGMERARGRRVAAGRGSWGKVTVVWMWEPMAGRRLQAREARLDKDENDSLSRSFLFPLRLVSAKRELY
jgi:hypothetical protein